jgi:hypothetical protein
MASFEIQTASGAHHAMAPPSDYVRVWSTVEQSRVCVQRSSHDTNHIPLRRYATCFPPLPSPTPPRTRPHFLSFLAPGYEADRQRRKKKKRVARFGLIYSFTRTGRVHAARSHFHGQAILAYTNSNTLTLLGAGLHHVS